MRLVEWPGCGCVFKNQLIQKDHDEGGYCWEKKGNSLWIAQDSVAHWKRVEPEAITEGEIREVALTGKIKDVGFEGVGIHQAVAWCMIWAFGKPGVKYCLNATKNTVPGASL